MTWVLSQAFLRPTKAPQTKNRGGFFGPLLCCFSEYVACIMLDRYGTCGFFSLRTDGSFFRGMKNTKCGPVGM